MKRKLMLEILADVVQGSGLQGDTEQELLNFISGLDVEEETLIKDYRNCIIELINNIDDLDGIKRIYRMACVLWRKKS